MNGPSGCWTCKVRRKKCDRGRPDCGPCSALNITCYHGVERPDWMDGGPRQEEMAERLKLEVKEKRPRRREKSSADYSGEIHATSARSSRPQEEAYKNPPMSLSSDIHSYPNIQGNEIGIHLRASTIEAQHAQAYTDFTEEECILTSTDWSDNVLLMFYLDNVFPHLFPFYRPGLLRDGGRAWIMEMMIKSPVTRQAILCQSSLFWSLGKDVRADTLCETVFSRTSDAFAGLRDALQVRLDSPVQSFPHCTVRLIASVVQLQRFDVAILNFKNCQQHLNAALELYLRLLNNASATDGVTPEMRFNAVLQSLRPSSSSLTNQLIKAASAEQAAFRFSSALLIVDDIIASTVLQVPPRLHEYHGALLSEPDDNDNALNLETVIGCQNWVLIELGKISVLDAWQQRCKKAGNLDVIELARQASSIRDSLQDQLRKLSTDPSAVRDVARTRLDAFTADYFEQSLRSVIQISVVTRVWAHATLIYLFIVVSGWQPANPDVRYHVDRVLELLVQQLQPRTLLRTVVWPFCVAGCLAELVEEDRIRDMVANLYPGTMFGTARKALEVMEDVWRSRNSGDTARRDLAACFRTQGDLILLV